MSIVARSMTPEAARACADRIKKGLDGIRADVLLLYEHEGWRQLGYGSWRECVVQEFEHSERHLYRLLTAARVEQNVQEIDPWVKNLPERQTRELQVLAPAEQQLVWQAVKATAPNGEPTAAHVRSLVTVAQDLERAGAIDDGTGEMVSWDALTPNRKLALLKANAAEETYERNMRQDEHIKERSETKDSRGHLKPEERARREEAGQPAFQKPQTASRPKPERVFVEPDDVESFRVACQNLIDATADYPDEWNAFIKGEFRKSLEQVTTLAGRFLA